MNARFPVRILVAALLSAAAPVRADFAGAQAANFHHQMHMRNTLGYHQTKVKYELAAWPRGGGDSLEFRSAFYTKGAVSFVHLDGDRFFFKEDSLIRYPEDFDSLRAQAENGTWLTARVVDSQWVFERYPGRAAIYSSEPLGGDWTHMDTGAGLVPFSEKALRRKLKEHPEAARALRVEKIADAVNWGMFIGGLGLAVTGLAVSQERVDENGEVTGFEFSPLAPIGVAIAVAGWIPRLIAEPQFINAIKAYNRPEDPPPPVGEE
jgi:hypothetical protein